VERSHFRGNGTEVGGLLGQPAQIRKTGSPSWIRTNNLAAAGFGAWAGRAFLIHSFWSGRGGVLKALLLGKPLLAPWRWVR
jgi:hypothetical protein